MIAKITNTKFIKEWHSEKWDKTYYTHLIEYDGKMAKYDSLSKNQTNFITGQEAEFEEEIKQGDKGEYIKIKPVRSFKKNSGYSRAVKKEQSRYSGFADSYVKDLIGEGVLLPEKTDEDIEHNELVMITWKKYSREIFEHMVEMDQSLES